MTLARARAQDPEEQEVMSCSWPSWGDSAGKQRARPSLYLPPRWANALSRPLGETERRGKNNAVRVTPL